MESFYDIGTSDLKDIWDSDLDTSDALKLSTDSDMQDWFLERDIKMSQVILHDKLISDALLANLPIKTEHSYSLNSDGDSMPDSPGSLQTKIEEMEDDCYLTIPTNTSNSKRFIDSTLLSSTTIPQYLQNSSNSTTNNTINNNNSINSNTVSRHQEYIGKSNSSTKLNSTATTILLDSDSMASSDIDIDDSCIKDEPMSPESSCPPSPITSQTHGISLSMANIAALTNSDIVFDHKNGSIKLSPSTQQSLLKSQQIILSETGQNLITSSPSSSSLTSSPAAQRIIIPKCNVRIEHQQQSSSVFGLPPTPPSSLPSDESEGNQSPEHHLISPMSPPQSITHQQNLTTPAITTSASVSTNNSNLTTIHTITTPSTSVSTRRNSTLHNNTTTSHHSAGGRSGYNGTSTRQPIHTPLISSQPKGSTGTLVLTEEEKRTLLAEGYPIPTRLPLTKAEEKSLKKIRRKIKNKISAQESRRKKKEYMDQLERKVEILVSENSDYRKRVETLEDSNANLLNQLARLQALINKQNLKKI